MEPVGASERNVQSQIIDWHLVATDSTAGCLFVAGLFAFLVGLSALGLGLWAGCAWLDWRVVVHLRDTPGDPVCFRRYVNRRVTTNGIAQVLAMVLGLWLAMAGHLALAFGIWVVAAAGIACSRVLSRLGTSRAP